MPEIARLITPETVQKIFNRGRGVEEIIEELERIGFELGEKVEDLVDFEGESIIKDSLRILKVCPMAL
jgi:hypothetical protein